MREDDVMQHLEDDFRSGALPLVLDATLLLQKEYSMLKKLETPRQCEVQSAEARCQNTAHWQFWFQAVCDQCIEQSASMGGPYGQQFAEALDDIHRRKLAPVIPYEVGDEPQHRGPDSAPV